MPVETSFSLPNLISFYRGTQPEKNATRAYDGILYSLSIRPRQSMLLKQVDFFGFPQPHKEKRQGLKDFKIHLMIKESVYPPKPCQNLQTLFPERMFRFSSKPGQDIYVILQHAVLIPAFMWVDVLFEIKGPETMHLAEHAILVDKIWDSNRQLSLDTRAGCSRQPKALHFEPLSN